LTVAEQELYRIIYFKTEIKYKKYMSNNNSTNQEIFYKAIDALEISELQKIKVKILAIEFAHKEYIMGTELATQSLI